MDNSEKWNSEEKRLERKERLNSLKSKDGGKKPIKKSSRFLRIFTPIIAVILVLSIGIWAMIYFAIPQKIFTPMTIGGNKVSSVEFSYYYASALQQLEIDNATAAGKAQLAAKCTETGFTDKTWQDYTYDMAAKSIVEIQIQYDLAKASNMALTADEQKEITDMFDNLITQTGDQVKADQYLINMFGKGVTIDSLKPIFMKQSLATKYANATLAAVEVADQEIADQYNSNKDKYDTVTFRLTYFKTETKTGETTEETAAFDAKSKAAAEAFLTKVTDEASFKKLVSEKEAAEKSAETAATEAAKAAAYAKMTDAEKATEDKTRATEAETTKAAEKAKADVLAAMTAAEKAAYDSARLNEDTSILRSLAKTNIDSASTDMGTWFFDAARKLGDKKVFSSNGGYYAVYFITRDAQETLPTVRHILITPNKDKDTTSGAVFTVEEWTAARTKAQELLTKCTSLDAFIALVADNSSDTATTTTGGLYENVKRDSMKQEFNDWCYDSSRKAGDQAIVRTDYGYHIMRFIENKATTALSRNSATIKTTLAQTKYTAQLDEKKTSTSYTYKISDFGIRLFTMGLPKVADTSTAASSK